MITENAIITDLIRSETSIWISVKFDKKAFPLHYEFDMRHLSNITRIEFLLKVTESHNVDELVGKSIRVIDTEETQNSLVAIGAASKNKFTDLYGQEFPVSEKRVYRRYLKKKNF